MISAMKKILADSGMSESSINAEEFTGFNLNETQTVSRHPWKKRVMIGAMLIVIPSKLKHFRGFIRQMKK